jgi:hypothetical protein
LLHFANIFHLPIRLIVASCQHISDASYMSVCCSAVPKHTDHIYASNEIPIHHQPSLRRFTHGATPNFFWMNSLKLGGYSHAFSS